MKVRALAEKDLRISLISPSTYVLVAVFSLICAYFFFNLLASFSAQLDRFYSLPVGGIAEQPNLNEWVVEPYFRSIAVVMMFFIPIYVIRFASLEFENSVLEFLRSLPVSASDIVLGRFVVLFVHHLFLLLIALSFPLLLFIASDPEILPILSGFAGLVFCVSSFCALSLCVSSLVRHPLASGVLSFFLLLVLYTLDFPAEQASGALAELLRFLSPMKQLEDPLRGVVHFPEYIYFFSLTLFSLYLACLLFSSRRGSSDLL